MSKENPNQDRGRNLAQALKTLGEQVDRVVTVCTRTQYNWGATTRLWEAAYRKAGEPLCMAAARLIANNVGRNDTAIISAGWVKLPYHPEGEYDGYAGAAALARAINVGVGARILVVTEEACVEPIRKVLSAAEMRVWDFQTLYNVPAYRSVSVVAFPTKREAARNAAVELLDATNAKLILAVERSDENEYGVHHTGAGSDMTEWTAKVQYLFREANTRGTPTIGCFDIGNEIGGAFIRDAVGKIIEPVGAKCICPCGGSIAGVTETTLGVVGRSSNAAAYGIAACLAGILGRPEVLYTREVQRRLMELMIELQLSDGPTLVNSFTEDGAPGELTLGLFDLLHWLVAGSIEGEGFPWDRPPFV